MHRPTPPLPKGGGFASGKIGGFRRLAGFHIGLYFWESACCGIPQSRLTPCQLPFTRELFYPVSFYGAIPGFFVLSIDSVGTRHPKNHNPKRGQRLKPRTRAKAKGQSPDGSTRGILNGGTIRAGASCSPLKPASLLPFLPEQERKAPLASACRKPIREQIERL